MSITGGMKSSVHDPEVMGSNPGQVERGVLFKQELSENWTKNITISWVKYIFFMAKIHIK